MNDLNCPYCDAELDVCHDDVGYEENTLHEMECPKCEKNFVFETTSTFSYSPEKADCLNDGNHIYTDWHQLYAHDGKSHQQKVCISCGDQKRQVVNADLCG